MAKTYVLSRMQQGGPHNVWRPVLAAYVSDYAVYSGLSTGKQWALCVVDDGVVVPPAADADPGVRVLSDVLLDQVPTTLQRNVINTRLAATDLGITAVAGETFRDILNKLGPALGHTSDFSIDRV